MRRHVGKAQVAPEPGPGSAAPTDVLRLDPPPPPPVFVDASGRRHRTLRRVALAAALAVLLALLLLWLSQLGGPVRPAPAAFCPTASAAGAPGTDGRTAPDGACVDR